MKFEIGTLINNVCGDRPILAVEIPGVGIIPAKAGDHDFDFIELNREQLKKLMKEIEKELNHAKNNDEAKDHME